MAGYASYPSLKDKAVFISGGGSGIGASIVEHFCAQGSKVAFVDVAKEASEKLVKDLAARQLPAPLFIHCDITDTPAYQKAIAIQRKLVRVEAGAQGAHKLARGYLPVQTYSAHWIRDTGLRRAVADYLKRERLAVAHEIALLGEESPYRRTE